MTVQTAPIPSYPATGTAVVSQLRNAQAKYRQRIEDIQAELDKTDEAFAEAFARADVTNNARDRIAALAKSNRQPTRR